MFTDMHVSGVRVLVIALNYVSPLNHSELTMESKVRRIFCPHCGEWVTKSTFYRHKSKFFNKHMKTWIENVGASRRSLAWPDPLRTGAYQLEIISAALRGSGILHSIQIF